MFPVRTVASSILLLGLAAAGPARAAGVFHWGRVRDGRGTFDLELTGGRITRIKGSVEETVRPYYELIGKDTEGESYSLAELGLDGKKATFGVRLEKRWRFFTLGLGGFYFHPSADTVALRDYYIGIANEIEFEGRRYEYMKIPEGQPFTADLRTFFCDLSLLFTPVTVSPAENFQFIPAIYLGVTGLFGTYDLDAGPPTGTVQYENPPRDYVVGGRTDGWAGVGVPAIGLGGEFRIGPPDGFRLTARARYGFFRYHGSTDHLPFSIRHEKHLDLEYENITGRIQAEVPLSARLDLLFGVSYTYLKFDGESTATEKTPEEIEELREKFDKKFDFEMSELHGFIGLRF